MTKAWALAAAAMVAAAVASAPPAEAVPLPAESFHYQLRNVDLAASAATSFRTLVLDPSRDGAPAGDWTPQEIADLKAAGKIVLAVVRIGEAESSRFYWDSAWVDPKTPGLHPTWLGPEDPDRPGIYRVKYWNAEWQKILFGTPSSYVDRVLAQGFEGLVLEGLNAYVYWGPDGKLPSAQRSDSAPADMIALITAIATYARSASANADFAIVPQNAAPLAADDGYVTTISGIVAEATWFLPGRWQKSAKTRKVVPFLDRVLAAGKPVLAMDYPSTLKHTDIFYDRAESKGYVPLATSVDRDVLSILPRHPAGSPVPFVQQSPAPNADAYPKPIQDFTWTDSSQGAVAYRVSFSGSEARQQVFSFPKGNALTETTYTPSASEWRGILRLARSNTAGALYWWITTIGADGTRRSSPARKLYRMHSDVPATIFWAGATAGETADKDRRASAWDADWVNHFGGVDDPFVRSSDPLHPFWPAFTPLENPFYLALPFNDFTESGIRRPKVVDIIPWIRFQDYAPLESMVKNRWVKITSVGATCYAQWEDVGPSQSYDFRYVFGPNRPRNKKNLGAGMEISPALRDCLGIGSIGATGWRFVYDDEVVPDGPWREIVTTSQIALPPRLLSPIPTPAVP